MMNLKNLTVIERVEGLFIVNGMLVLLYYQAADFKLVLFISICFAYLLDKTVTTRKQFDAVKEELALIKRGLK
ncbi:MAG: putative PurR-regulated permease PerM [Phenylobacterium sp.]|jgi:predicted PurR-regulated permease PerM